MVKDTMAEETFDVHTAEGNLTEQLIATRAKPKKKEKNPVEVLQKFKLPAFSKKEATEAERTAVAAPKPRNWRHHLPHHVNNEINELVKETHNHRDAYKKTMKARDAQLWVALAHINQRLKELEKRLDRY